MHTLDLGGLQHFLGSLFWTLVFDSRLAGGKEINMFVVWQRVRDLYDELRVQTRLSNLELKFFCNPDKPRQDCP
eukprot:4111166-Alexandrium_andersonii.AAC.1